MILTIKAGKELTNYWLYSGKCLSWKALDRQLDCLLSWLQNKHWYLPRGWAMLTSHPQGDWFLWLTDIVMGSGMGCLPFSLWLVKYLNEQTEPCIAFLPEPCGSCFFIFLLIGIDKNGNVCKWDFCPNLPRFKKVLSSLQIPFQNALWIIFLLHTS